MMNKSDYLRNALVSHALRHVSFTSPASHFLALFTVTPTSSGGGTEVTGGSYARQAVTFAAPTLGATSNTGSVTFPTPTADWGEILGVAVFDAVSSGNMLYFGAMTPKLIYTADDIFFPSGFFTITES